MDSLLDLMKKTLLIPLEETYADEEIRAHILSCKELLISSGVPKEVVEEDDPLVKGLITIYVKTMYGWKSDGSVKELPKSFDLLLKQLCLHSKEVEEET